MKGENTCLLLMTSSRPPNAEEAEECKNRLFCCRDIKLNYFALYLFQFRYSEIIKMDPLIALRNMPNVSVGDLDYEQGFDEALLINPDFADAFSCPICIGIPRHPIYLAKCQHFFC